MKDYKSKLITLLGLSHESDLLQTLDNQLSKSCPQSWFHKAYDFHTAVQYLASYTYELVIVDINIIGGYELIIRASAHKFPVLVLVNNYKQLTPSEQEISSEAQAVLLKREISEVNMVSIIEKIILPKNNLKWNRTSKDFKKWWLMIFLKIIDGKIE